MERAGRRLRRFHSCWEIIGSWQLLRQGESVFFRDLDPRAYPCPSRWTCTHVYTGTWTGLSWWGHEVGREGGEEGKNWREEHGDGVYYTKTQTTHVWTSQPKQTKTKLLPGNCQRTWDKWWILESGSVAR